MPGRGPAPKPPEQRRTRHVPTRGEWVATAGVGWQHGEIPEPPDGIHAPTVEVWRTWMRAWWASHWVPEDLPGLAIVIRLYDQCQEFFDDPYVEKTTRKGDSIYVLKPNPATELRQMMDNYGITPKGQTDRRWAAPKEEDTKTEPKAKAQRYGHLRSVG